MIYCEPGWSYHVKDYINSSQESGVALKWTDEIKKAEWILCHSYGLRRLIQNPSLKNKKLILIATFQDFSQKTQTQWMIRQIEKNKTQAVLNNFYHLCGYNGKFNADQKELQKELQDMRNEFNIDIVNFLEQNECKGWNIGFTKDPIVLKEFCLANKKIKKFQTLWLDSQKHFPCGPEIWSLIERISNENE